MTVEFHPVSSIWPLMEQNDLEDLAADIKEHGQHLPIILVGGLVLDGRNRVKACEIAGVEPWFEETDTEDPDALAWSLNEHRRHVSETVRAMAAAKRATLGKGRPTTNAPQDAISQPEAAEQFGVSRRSVQRATAVLKHGAPELVEATERGAIPVKEAAEIARKPADEQRKVIKLPTAGEARKQAREQGTSVAARDGKLYSGKTLEQERTEHRATLIMAQLSEALKAIGTMPVTPADYIALLPDHPTAGRYMDNAVSEHLVGAFDWLSEFVALWEEHEKRRAS
jgi:ParB-like chromosome segregation protein Spo0J